MAKKKTQASLFLLTDEQKETMRQMESYFDSLQAYFDAYNDIVAKAAQSLTSMIRAELVASLHASDIKLGSKRSASNKTAKLEYMIKQSVIYFTKKGMSITIGPGFTESDYQKVGALNYGALRGSTLKNTKSRASLRESLAATGQKSLIYERTRKGIQTTDALYRIDGHSFYTLNTGQIVRINAKLIEALQREINASFAKLKKAVA